jgi:hypothetical protein
LKIKGKSYTPAENPVINIYAQFALEIAQYNIKPKCQFVALNLAERRRVPFGTLAFGLRCESEEAPEADAPRFASDFTCFGIAVTSDT